MNQKTLLFLDDIRVPNYVYGNLDFNFIWVTNYSEFKNHLKTCGLPDRVSFDHDLGGIKNGFDCAKFMVEYCMNKDLDLPEYAIHSANPVGAENIKKYLDNYKEFRKK